MIRLLPLSFALALLVPAMAFADGEPTSEVDPYAGWSAITDTYATADGGFRYTALIANPEHVAALDSFVAWVAVAEIDGWSRSKRLAFWINAYNAVTVKAVLTLWPVQSVLAVDGFFDGLEYRVAGTSMTLNDLEHVHIRAAFNEPRIHFLVNCASVSCPPLVREVITERNLESLLERQTRAYVRGTTTFDREAGSFGVSQIFEWFAGDFEGAGGVRAFIADRLEGDDAAFVRDEANTMTYWQYDWGLNGR